MNQTELGNICKLRNGYAFKRDDFINDGIPIVRIGDINNGNINLDSTIKVKEKDLFNSFLIQKGAILIAMSGATTGKIGKYSYDIKAYQNQRVGCFIPDNDKINNEYLYCFLKTLKDKILQKAYGGGQPNISPKDIESLKIPLPSLNDQIRIAAVLTRAENLIAKRKESIESLDEFLKSTFLEMFGPSSNDFHKWPIVEIKDLAAEHKGSMRTGPFGSNLLHSEFTESGDVAVLGIDNAVQNKFAWDQRRYITMEKYAELNSYRIYPGDVIITIMGTVGRSAVIPDDIPLAINTKHLAAITFDRKKANPHFISYSFHSSPYIIKQLASKNRGAIMDGLNLGLIKETKLRKPPVDLQNKFAAIVEKVESMKVKYNESLVEMEKLYGSLSQRAFRGEL